jgi:superfamily II DNA or RNA helicase
MASTQNYIANLIVDTQLTIACKGTSNRAARRSMITLKDHQEEALHNIITEIAKNNGIALGRIVIPTGGGKTFVEAATLDWQRKNNSKTRIHLVLAPRILLVNQLIDAFREYSGNNTYRAIAFHSGHYEPDYTKIKWKEPSTTKVDDIAEAYKNAIKNDQDLVVFSTYHSCHNLVGINFDTLISDESQYCVSENFNDSVKSLTARVKLFFTATELHTASNKGRGLNNESIFGKRLYSISSAELIKLKLIVPPRLHIMYGKTRDEEATIVSEVVQMANEQDRLTRSDLGFSKILFAMKGTDDVKTIEDNIAKVRKDLPEHDIFTITSKTGARVNGVKIPREQFLRELTTRKNCLIFHYDILSEGIDIDGITGVCLMRNLGLAKLLQTIGRAVRLYKPNPLLKRQAWISVAVINGDEDDKERVKKYVNAIRNGGFDITKDDIVETGLLRHTADETGVDDAYINPKNNFSNLFVTEVLHEIEEEEFWKDIRVAESDDEKLDILFS